MNDFLDLIEAIDARDATVRNLYEDTRGEVSHGSRRANKDPRYLQNLAATQTFVVDVLEGRRPMYHLKEAMSRSDFPLLFGDILDRTMMASYQSWPVTWDKIAARATVNDFRVHQRFYTDGGDEGVTEVKELTEYPETKVNEGRYQVSVKKYGKRIGFSWEMVINDDVDFLRQLPVGLARGARRTESRFATDLFVGPSGPDAALYTAPNGNIVTGNPALGIPGLTAALGALGSMTYLGEPILVDMVTLVVPPALEMTARAIINATQIEVTGLPALGVGGTGATATTGNWLANRLVLDVNPYIPLLATTANGTTSWFLFANPSNGRPALEMDFLRGHESPELFQKAPNALRLGGGAADPMDGSYEIDAVEYKVRHVFGGGIIDPKMTVASNGTGS